jgi:putative restriction endonuclease
MTNDNNLVRESVNEICAFSKMYSQKKRPIRSSDPLGIGVLRHLRNLSGALENLLFQQDGDVDRFVIRYSKGQSNLPKVLYVAILPKGRKAYEFMSISMCFDIKGRGFIGGLMDSASMRTGWADLITRSDEEKLEINVNGPKPNTHYNDRFVNPKVFPLEFNEQELVNHLRESMDLLLSLVSKNLGYTL